MLGDLSDRREVYVANGRHRAITEEPIATESEKENAAALRTMFKDRKVVLKTETKKFAFEYKQALQEANAEYKRATQRAKDEYHQNLFNVAKTEMDTIMTSDEFQNADPKTKSKIEGFRDWMNYWASSGDNNKCKFGGCHDHHQGHDSDEDDMTVREVIYPDEKKTPL
ncbi:hypothetical protein BGZ83_011102 [Gryganskiella cystojenkinii]|nr:hypothetical protein BGZ83_011102 [Gryganskiella cystojenkinii]